MDGCADVDMAVQETTAFSPGPALHREPPSPYASMNALSFEELMSLALAAHAREVSLAAKATPSRAGAPPVAAGDVCAVPSERFSVRRSRRSTRRSEAYFRIFEHVANAAFILEMTGRISMQRMAFFWDPVQRQLLSFNCVDSAIVIICSVDLYSQSGGPSELSAMRLVRFVRLARAFRVLRVMTSFSKLRILLRTTASSFASLFWAMVLMFLVIYGTAMSLCQSLQKTLNEDNLPEDLRQWIYAAYGSGSRALWTLFVITFSGGSPNYVQRLVEEVHPLYALFFAAYVWVVIFTVTRIITALFLKDTLRAASEDQEMVLREQRATKSRTTKKLERLFQAADSSGDGLISVAEFQEVVASPQGLAMFHALELQPSEAAQMFELFDDGDGLVSYEEFCQGVMQLKGQARAMDIITILRDCRRIIDKCDVLEGLCAQGRRHMLSVHI